jgi:hypothetical protein
MWLTRSIGSESPIGPRERGNVYLGPGRRSEPTAALQGDRTSGPGLLR